jgi:hypothetical protein
LRNQKKNKIISHRRKIAQSGFTTIACYTISIGALYKHFQTKGLIAGTGWPIRPGKKIFGQKSPFLSLSQNRKEGAFSGLNFFTPCRQPDCKLRLILT